MEKNPIICKSLVGLIGVYSTMLFFLSGCGGKGELNLTPTSANADELKARISENIVKREYILSDASISDKRDESFFDDERGIGKGSTEEDQPVPKKDEEEKVDIETEGTQKQIETGIPYSFDGADEETERAVYIDSNGNLGIGTMSPEYKVDILGDLRVKGTIYGTITGTVSNADTVDNIHASAIPTANYLTALGPDANLPEWVVDMNSIEDGAVTSVKIYDGTIRSHDIALNAIVSSRIMDGTIDNVDLMDDSVTSEKIHNETLVNADIATSAAILPSKIFGTAWTSNNDGPDSGLDADLLDGQQGNYYLPAENILGSSGYLARFGGANSLRDSVVYETGSKVGIMTTNPAFSLDISGSGRIYDQTPSPGASTLIVRAGAGQETNPLTVWKDNSGNDLVRLTSSGWLGIGTTNPNTNLDVAGMITGDGLTIDGTVSGMGFNGWDRDVSDDITTEGGMNITGGLNMATDSGNIGVGTTLPMERLHVGAGSDPSMILATRIYATEDFDVGMAIRDSSNDIESYWATTSANNAAIFGTATNHDLRFVTDNSEKAIITASGNFGIGNTNPSFKLDVSGSERLYDQTPSTGVTTLDIRAGDGQAEIPLTLWRDSSGNGLVGITASGWLGIGTVEPNSNLHIYDTRAAKFTLETQSNSATSQLSLAWRNASNTRSYSSGLNQGNGLFYIDADPALSIKTNGSDQIRITNTGNVGIGTTSPEARLEVLNGDIKLSNNNYLMWGGMDECSIYGNDHSALTFRSNSIDTMILSNGNVSIANSVGIGDTLTVSKNRLVVSTSGNVGIGKANPQSTLHVKDVMRLEPQASAPNGDMGDIYVGTDGKLYFHNGKKWSEVAFVP